MASSEPTQHFAARRLGTLLRDKYRLTELLGVGGMAAVYLGVHENNKNRVAVKVLHGEASAHEDLRARFLREGYVANSIGHRGAVRVLDDDVAEDGAAYLVMELLEGETLHARAERLGGRLPPREALALGRELCAVLAAAHEKGIVHRDIKPENLFLTTDRVLKVLDFGIARVLDAPAGGATWTGAALGTPAFMPPEQALGRQDEVDARTDLWAVGATLFTLLSGSFVHEGRWGAELVVRSATAPARSLAVAAPDLPAEIVAVVDRALRFAQEDRWPSATAMAAALEDAHRSAFGEAPSSASSIGEVPTARPERTVAPDAPTEAAPAASSGRGQVGSGAPAAPRTHVSGSSLPSEAARAPTPSASGTPVARTQSGGVSVLRPTEPVPEPRSLPPSGRGRRALTGALALITAAALGLLAARLPPQRAAPVAPPGTSTAAAGTGCVDHRGCVAANGGRPSICRRDDGICVPLETDACRVLAGPGDIENDATVWVGAMFPLHTEMATAYGFASRDAVDLGRRDFAETAGGLPPTRPGGARRPLAVVLCDDATDPTRAADHLVHELRVPAVLGFALSKEVADLAASHFLPRGVLALASNTASMLSSIPHAPGAPRLVWRTTTSTDMSTAAVAALLTEVVEPNLRATPGALASGEPLRVALVRVGNASGRSASDQVVARLRFNGKSVAENGAAFREVVLPDIDDPAEQRGADAHLAAEIALFRPHAIVSYQDGPLAPAVERAWPVGRRHRPVYLGLNPDRDETQAMLRERPDLATRILRIDTVASTTAVAKFVLRHNEVFRKKIAATEAKSAPYDAFYLLAYAIAALGSEPVTGTALARALHRLTPPGAPVDVGPGGIYTTLHALSSGQNVDLQGTITTLDFDPQTGDPTADLAVFCAGPEGSSESGLVYRARTGKFDGTLRCR